MLYSDVVTKTLLEVYGSDPAQPEITTAIYGSEGIIGNIHRQIQEDNDLWFMLAPTTETLVDAQAAYNIDYEFKKEIDRQFIETEKTAGYNLEDVFKYMYAEMPQALRDQQIEHEKFLQWKNAKK